MIFKMKIVAGAAIVSTAALALWAWKVFQKDEDLFQKEGEEIDLQLGHLYNRGLIRYIDGDTQTVSWKPCYKRCWGRLVDPEAPDYKSNECCNIGCHNTDDLIEINVETKASPQNLTKGTCVSSIVVEVDAKKGFLGRKRYKKHKNLKVVELTDKTIVFKMRKVSNETAKQRKRRKKFNKTPFHFPKTNVDNIVMRESIWPRTPRMKMCPTCLQDFGRTLENGRASILKIVEGQMIRPAEREESSDSDSENDQAYRAWSRKTWGKTVTWNDKPDA